ncbi:MAG: adenylate/guanylate cyclase domain-containing protein [Pseudolabrys sp.]|nr:adenylate/guanylate cyclase domain-containing protein [Pseudolabrys sp.]
MSTDEMNARFNRALAAYLRQQVQAPASAVSDFLAIIIEDARRLELADTMADLDRMQTAATRLNAFVAKLIEDTSADRKQDESFDDFQRRLRHDLRTPLNAVIGYSEMLIEDMESDAEAPLRADLIKLKESADFLLGQIDAMVALARDGDKTAPKDEGLTRHLGLIADTLRTVQPLRGTTTATYDRQGDILVVDDNASNRDVLERRLVREGHRIVTAENGAIALALCEEQDFDLILLDLIMPEIGGYEVLQRLKASERNRHIPVIVISALDEIDSIIRCIEAGAEDYLPKPFDPILLRTRIDTSLEKKWMRDREKQLFEDLDREKQKSEALLLNILPQSIANRMRAGEVNIADQVTEASILFCDLVGFTKLSGKLSPQATVDFLGKIFTEFDRLAEEAGVEKIKTIGDAYMAAAGIPEPQTDHAFRIARLAPRMLQAVRDVSAETGLKLHARIGIHSGPIVAGVIGTHKFVYDVWGDSVNTASRMESHSEPDRIHVSETTRRVLDGHFRFEPRGAIEVKGKGLMETYFLVED